MPQFVGDANFAHAQGGCYRCARGDNLVDMDAQIVGEGALVICKNCILDAAEAAGLSLNAAAVAELTAAIEAERKQFSTEAADQLRAELAAAHLELQNERSVVDRLMGKVYVEVSSEP